MLATHLLSLLFLVLEAVAQHHFVTRWSRPLPPRLGARLRDGKEISVHLKPRETKRFYFLVEESNRPLWLFVTPCGGTIKWRLTEQVQKKIKKLSSSSSNREKEKLNSDTKTSPKSMTAHESDVFNMIITENSSKKSENSEGMWKAEGKEHPNSILSSWTQSESSMDSWGYASQEQSLVQEVGRGRMEHYSMKQVPGIRHLYIEAPHRPTSVQLFVTSDLQRLNAHFPKLPSSPRDKRVHLTNISATAAAIRWRHSPSVDWFKYRHIQYCLGLSVRKHFHTYCELENDGQAVEEQETAKSNKLAPERQKAHFATSPSETSNKPFSICTKYRNSYQFDGLKPDTKYYLSLFAVNTESGGTATYDGLSFRSPREDKPKKRVGRLRDGAMVAAYLNPSKAAFQLYEFSLHHFQKHVVVIVQPCSGYVRLNLYKNKKVIRHSVTSELRRFVVSRVTPGTIKIKIINDDNDAKVFKLLATVHPTRDPYPQLPDDTSIWFLENSRSCDGVTLVWFKARGQVQYCLYKHMEKDDYFKRLILEESSQCRDPSTDSKLVLCRKQRRTSSAWTMQADAFGLKPGTTYRFDLVVTPTGPNNQTLAYRTIWVKTKKNC